MCRDRPTYAAVSTTATIIPPHGGRRFICSYCPLDVRVDIQMSVPPNPPCRLEAKTSVRPLPERLGCCSAAVEFRASTFAGVDQESCTLRRVDVQRSAPPRPPERVEKKRISRPSARSVAPWSVAIGSLSSGISIAGPRVSPSRVMGAK